jgi:hypothetical protein
MSAFAWWNHLHDDALARTLATWTPWHAIKRVGESMTAFDDLVEIGVIERRNIQLYTHGIASGWEIEFRLAPTPGQPGAAGRVVRRAARVPREPGTASAGEPRDPGPADSSTP